MTGNKFLWLRLKHERKELEKYYNGEKFSVKWMNGEATFEREIATSQNRVYRLRIYVGENYPDEFPKLVVCDSPEPMPKSEKWQGTHTTHTWPQKYGFLQICFYRPICWTRENKLYQVFEKGEPWLEAYEEYLKSGKPINESLPEMEPREEEKREELRLKRQLNVVKQNFAKNKLGVIAFDAS